MKKLIITSLCILSTSLLIAQEDQDTISHSEQQDNTLSKYIEKLQNIKGYIRNKGIKENRRVNPYIVGIWTAEEKIFVVFDVQNKTLLNFDIENFTFEKKEDRKKSVRKMKFINPIWEPKVERISKNSIQRLIFVFNPVNISNQGHIIFTIEEKGEDRTIYMPIQGINWNNPRLLK